LQSAGSATGAFSGKDWMAYEQKANKLEKINRFDEAEEYYRKALAETRKPGADPACSGDTLGELASLLRKKGQHSQAISYYEQCLAIRRKQWGERSQRLDSILEALASEYLLDRRWADADKLLRALVEMRESTLLPNDPKLLKTLYDLETVCVAEGKVAEAERLHLRQFQEKQKSPRSSQLVAIDLRILAELYLSQRKWNDAEKTLKQELAIRLDSGDTSSTLLQDNLLRLGQCEGQLGQPEKALVVLKRGLAISEKQQGEKSSKLLNFIAPLCNCSIQAKRYAEAEVYCKRRLAIVESSSGKTAVQVGRALKALQDLYEQWGKPEQAKIYREKLVPR
jgi:tetratricopeptide (TPR) repeat protein